MLQIKDKKIWYTIFLYGLCSLLFHMFFMDLTMGDDPYYTEVLREITMNEFLIKRWTKWSSRLLMEIACAVLIPLPAWIWMILDVAASMILAYALLGMFYHKKEDARSIIFAGILLFLYDFRDMNTAGWMTTTIFYWWALVTGVVAFIPVYLDYKKEPVKLWVYVVAVLCSIYAANLEVVTIAFVCTSVYMLAVYWREGRKAPKYLYYLLVLGLIWVGIVLICPGNEVRKIANIDFWFPNYANFNLIQKGLLGWFALLKSLFQDIHWLFFGFSIVIMWAVFKKEKKWYEKLIAAVPFLSNLALGACLIIANFYDAGPVNKVVHAFDFDQPIVYYQGSLPMKLGLLMLAYTFVCVCVMYSMYVLWGATKKFSHMMAVLVIGTITKLSLGMSATVWASSERTTMILMFAFIIIGTFCGEEILKKE